MALEEPVLRNIGFGPAFDVQTDKVQGTDFEVVFEEEPVIRKDETKVAKFKAVHQGQPTGMSSTTALLSHLIESQGQAEMPVSITYADASGKRYRSKQVVRYDAASRAASTIHKGVEPV